MKRNVFDILDELAEKIRGSESPRAYALLALGYCAGVAMSAGVSSSDVADLFCRRTRGKAGTCNHCKRPSDTDPCEHCGRGDLEDELARGARTPESSADVDCECADWTHVGHPASAYRPGEHHPDCPKRTIGGR